MRFLLDTNICIYLIKKKPLEVLKKFQSYQVSEIGISSLTLAELQFGVHRSQRPAQNQKALNQFLIPLEVANFNDAAATTYGFIRAELEKQGKIIGALDLLIAAHAVSLDITLVTNSTDEFVRVPALKVENWVRT